MTLTPMTRLPSAQEESVEEALSEIYECCENNMSSEKQLQTLLDEKIKPGILEELNKGHFVDVTEGIISLTEGGTQIAHQVIRRKRLAERLLKDVLNVKDEFIDPTACQWEHILSKEVTNSICTLLGHPSHSPRDFFIPPGDCCKQVAKTIVPVICSLDKLHGGDKATIAYLLIKKNPQLQQLLSLGLTPGTGVAVIQRFPTFVVQVNESQLAFDEAIAQAIYVYPAP